MTKTVELDVAQATLPEIIAGLGPDEEVVIVQNRKPVAQLSAPKPERKPRQPGLFKDVITVVSEDDEHLKDFEE
jgi:hypothetical protein